MHIQMRRLVSSGSALFAKVYVLVCRDERVKPRPFSIKTVLLLTEFFKAFFCYDSFSFFVLFSRKCCCVLSLYGSYHLPFSCLSVPWGAMSCGRGLSWVPSILFNIIWATSSEKSVFDHEQNAQIQFVLRIRNVSPRRLLSIHIFCSIQ